MAAAGEFNDGLQPHQTLRVILLLPVDPRQIVLGCTTYYPPSSKSAQSDASVATPAGVSWRERLRVFSPWR